MLKRHSVQYRQFFCGQYAFELIDTCQIRPDGLHVDADRGHRIDGMQHPVSGMAGVEVQRDGCVLQERFTELVLAEPDLAARDADAPGEQLAQATPCDDESRAIGFVAKAVGAALFGSVEVSPMLFEAWHLGTDVQAMHFATEGSSAVGH